MDKYNCFTPKEVHENMVKTAVTKASLSWVQMLVLGVMAGLCIALGASSSNVAMHNISNVGLQRLVAGCVFPVGLMSLVLAGGELFTGNTMMLSGVVAKQIKFSQMLKNWVLVYLGNLIGSVLIAFLVSQTGQWNYTDGMLGAMTIKIAVGKVNLSPWTAICSGIMCNMFVCLAVLMASAAKAVIGKLFAIFFPICAFVISGYEHCVANMYYIPAGIMAKSSAAYCAKAQELYGITAEQLNRLTVGHFLYDNLFFVTIGNIIGGGVLIGLVYYFAFVHCNKSKK
jgi:formate/nitrite transporter